MSKLTHAEKKCKGCGKAFINYFTFDCPEERDKAFILCLHCANTVHRYLNRITELVGKK